MILCRKIRTQLFVLHGALNPFRYFKVYDTEDRQGLLEAYHDQVGQ